MTAEINKRPHIHASSFHPFNAEGKLTLLPSHWRLLSGVFGNDALKALRAYLGSPRYASPENIVIDGKIPSEPLPDFLVQLNETNFGSDYINAEKDGLEARKAVVSFLELPATLVGNKDEVSSKSENIYDNMYKIFSNEYPDKIRFEMIINQLFAFESLSRNYKSKVEKKSTSRSEFVDWLDKSIFTGLGEKMGEDHGITVYSLHEPDTFWNRGDVRLNEPFTQDEMGDFMYKKNEMRVRYCILDGKEYKILSNTREKNDGDALLKGLRKALIRKNRYDKRTKGQFENMIKPVDASTRAKESDKLDYIEDVADLIGAKFVVVEGDRDEFVNSLEVRLHQQYGEVVDRSQTNLNKDGSERGGTQSKRHTFIRKELPQYNNLEIVIYTLQEYLNSEYDIGIREANGEFSGASHEIYAATRIASIAHTLFPKEIYPDLNLQDYIDRAIERVIEQLQNKNTIQKGIIY